MTEHSDTLLLALALPIDSIGSIVLRTKLREIGTGAGATLPDAVPAA